VDIRTIPGRTNQGLFAKLRAYLGEGVTVSKVLDVDGVSTDPEHPWVRSVFDLTTSSRGQRPAPQIVTYFTDAAFLKPAFNHPPTLLIGPGEPGMAHKTDEFCHVSKIEEAAETYFQIARQWCEI
jgi:succinyl-diaminopimelate desuccinylase